MAKLYPPYIEGTIPAFYKDEENDGAVFLTVPLSMNKAVGEPDVKSFVLKIKTAQTGILLGTFEQDKFEDGHFTMTPKFDLAAISNKLVPGQYYKVQIAYIDKNDEVGYYSTVGIAKYTTKPEISIDGLTHGVINNHKYEYTGLYSQKNKDITERVYSYYFNVYDSEGKVVHTTGQLLHNRNNDIENYMSEDAWLFSQDLKINKVYYIEYVVTTTNNMQISSGKYRFMQKETVNPEIKVDVIAKLNHDNGYVDIFLQGYENEYGVEEPEVGAFLISRKEELDDTWREVFRFNLSAEQPTGWLWRDFTIEQGRKYTYALQQYNDYGLYSNKILSNEVYADFEDAFLFDGKQQLKIKYNPKVSSFKNTIMEAKVDTIGGKHPFIFRNGSINYKEFPISGLISYLMDEEEIFISADDIGLLEKTTSLVSENVAAEREFKLKVLDWLTNGEPKLFRSPTEGNYIVRLLNVSLSPNDTLGRMLHSFNATAYEIEDYTFENLNKYKIVHVDKPMVEKLQWRTINFVQSTKDGLVYYNKDQNILEQKGKKMVARTVQFRDVIPGTNIRIHQQDEKEDLIIKIGATGAYQIESPVGITGIYLLDPYTNGNVTFSYYTVMQNTFNTIAQVSIEEVPMHQFKGLGHDVNIIDSLQDIRTEIAQFYHLDFNKRPTEYMYKLNGEYYHDLFCTQKIDINSNIIDPYYIYEVYKGYDKKTSINRGTHQDELLYYTDGSNFGEEIKNYDNYIYINGSQVDLTETENFHLNNMNNITSLTIGAGVVLNATYQLRIKTYNLEIDVDATLSVDGMVEDLQATRAAYLKSKEDLAELRNSFDDNENMSYEEFMQQENRQKELINSLYKEYIEKLAVALETYKEDNVIT